LRGSELSLRKSEYGAAQSLGTANLRIRLQIAKSPGREPHCCSESTAQCETSSARAPAKKRRRETRQSFGAGLVAGRGVAGGKHGPIGVEFQLRNRARGLPTERFGQQPTAGLKCPLPDMLKLKISFRETATPAAPLRPETSRPAHHHSFDLPKIPIFRLTLLNEACGRMRVCKILGFDRTKTFRDLCSGGDFGVVS
jgi:hypothetical protein